MLLELTSEDGSANEIAPWGKSAREVRQAMAKTVSVFGYGG